MIKFTRWNYFQNPRARPSIRWLPRVILWNWSSTILISSTIRRRYNKSFCPFARRSSSTPILPIPRRKTRRKMCWKLSDSPLRISNSIKITSIQSTLRYKATRLQLQISWPIWFNKWPISAKAKMPRTSSRTIITQPWNVSSIFTLATTATKRSIPSSAGTSTIRYRRSSQLCRSNWSSTTNRSSLGNWRQIWNMARSWTCTGESPSPINPCKKDRNSTGKPSPALVWIPPWLPGSDVTLM